MSRTLSVHRNGSAPEQHFVLNGVSYGAYVTIADALGEQPIRLTYSQGSLELMTISREHERGKSLLVKLVAVLTLEMDIDAASGGGMTFRREELDRGMEPDDCLWIQNEPIMRGRDDYQPDTDPPPDLAMEVEVSRNLLNRLQIYAAIRVPEVWRWDGQRVQVLLLGADGKYVESERSQAFPFLPMGEINRFLALRTSLSETKILQQFQRWVREQRELGWPATELAISTPAKKKSARKPAPKRSKRD